jgi:hypothetical protein
MPHLNLDALRHVFKFLDKNDLKNVARVSKQWNEASNSPVLWNSYWQRNWIGLHILGKLINDYSKLSYNLGDRNIIHWDDDKDYHEIVVDENLMTKKQYVALTDTYRNYRMGGYLATLFSEDGISALREKLITLEQIKVLAMAENQARSRMTDTTGMLVQRLYLYFLLHANARDALRAKLITPEQAALMPTAEHLKWLLVITPDNDGPALLREKLMTPEQAARMPTADHIHFLASPEGVAALKDEKLTAEQAIGFRTVDEMKQSLARLNKPGCTIS